MTQILKGRSVPCSSGAEIQLFADKHRLKTRISEDGTRIIPGKFGNVYLYDDSVLGVIVMPHPPRKHYWGHVRTAMLEAGFVVVQDGDCEGSATFDPTDPHQVEVAIRAAGIKRKREVSSEQRQKQIERLRAPAGRPLCAPGTRTKPKTTLSPIQCDSAGSGTEKSAYGGTGFAAGVRPGQVEDRG